MNTITEVPREARWSVFYLFAALAVLAGLVVAPQVDANEDYFLAWQDIYEPTDSDNNAGRGGCQICHGPNNNLLVNNYGNDFRIRISQPINETPTQAIQFLDTVDSDAPQGDDNGTEIGVNAQPGWTSGLNPLFNRNTGADAGSVDPLTIGVQEPLDPPAAVCDFSVSPTSFDFGDVVTQTTSTRLVTTVTNIGGAACSIDATVSSTSGQFALASTTPIVLDPTESAQVSVDFSPVNLGLDDTGNLNLTDGVVDIDVPLSGTGVAELVCDFSVSPTSFDFGDVTITTTSTRVATTVTNIGGAACSIDAAVSSASGQFALASVTPIVLDPTESAQVSVDFSPVNLGLDDTGNLNLTDGVTTLDVPLSGTGVEAPGGGSPIARGDTYATAIGKELVVQLSRVSGVLYNDFDTDDLGNNLGSEGLTAVLETPPANAADFTFRDDGSFDYTPDDTLVDNTNDSFTYRAVDGDTPPNSSEVVTVNIHVYSDQTDFKIMMNYELGMHCTGFEFSYCCVLPPYNSILAQVVRPQPQDDDVRSNADFARLLEGDPNNGLDGLGRETVVRDFEHDGTFKKYYLEYFHDAQPRREGNMPGTFNSNELDPTLISDIEGNSMLYHNTPYDSALVDDKGKITGVPGKLVRDTYNGVPNVVVGDGDYMGATDNYANGWLNHFYIYSDLEGSVSGSCVNRNGNVTGGNRRCTVDADCPDKQTCDLSLERNKIRLGVAGMVEYPANVGAALQPMGPVSSTPVPFDNVLTFSADSGTVVYTQMKVLENLPIMLTSPRIWEALGLPLTPFEDSIDFFGAPGLVDEDSIRPYVAMKARLHEANCDGAGNCTQGPAVIGSNDQPVIGHGTAPIDIPNCERCHSVPAFDPVTSDPNVNSPSYVRRPEVQGGLDPFSYPHPGDNFGVSLEAITDLEIEYWKAFYPSLQTDSDWYARLKGAAINMLAMHDADRGTSFLVNYPTSGIDEPLNDVLGMPASKQIPQNTRVGHESIICQKCHGDNVIAAVNPLGPEAGFFLPPISEAIHNTHRNKSEGGVIVFNDGLGRDGGCQGCHPAHRSDGVMDNYPITLGGNNANADGDNRLNQGGCFVGRDVHSNPLKDVDGAETPEHLNAVGEWLVANVTNEGNTDPTDPSRGIWCTNCHSQLGQDIWAAEDCDDLINSDPNDPTATDDCKNNVRAQGSLAAIAAALELPGGVDEAIEKLDPRSDPGDPTQPFPGYSEDFTHAIWRANIPDAGVATIEVSTTGPGACAPLVGVFNAAFGVDVCVRLDADGDPNVNILSFCTTDDCVAQINDPDNRADASWRHPEGGTVDGVAGFAGTGTAGAPVPFSAATDGRDHWLAAGEPHCADCHEAPYVEQSGNINPFPPFNYPAKASLMRYSRGHQDLGCQACHESIHGLYPVSAAIDTTSYAQAAALNADGSHGPLKCGACHQVDENGIPNWHEENGDGDFDFDGGAEGLTGFDNAVTFAHTFTDEADPLDSLCQNCHGDESDGIAPDPDELEDWEEYVEHAMVGRTSRLMMDKAEVSELGHVLGAEPGDERNQLCSVCHDGDNELGEVECDDEWRQHLSQGRVSESVWEEVSLDETGTTCGW